MNWVNVLLIVNTLATLLAAGLLWDVATHLAAIRETANAMERNSTEQITEQIEVQRRSELSLRLIAVLLEEKKK